MYAGVMAAGMAAMAAAMAGQTGAVMDLGAGPVATTSVAVTVLLDPAGRVESCTAATANACAGFPKGRLVALPLRRGGKPVAGKMTVSTTTVVSPR